MLRSQWLRSVLIVGSLSLLIPVVATARPNKSSSVTIKGPSSVKLGHKFSFRISGFATSPANFVAVREAGSSCAATYQKEFSKSVPTNQSKNVTPGKSFSFDVNGKADNAGKHYLCVYVLNFQTVKTYAHAGKSFVDHK